MVCYGLGETDKDNKRIEIKNLELWKVNNNVRAELVK